MREAHDAERELAAELLRVRERHRVDHDVFHLTRTLEAWSERHLQALAEHAARYDVDLEDAAVDDGGLLARLRERAWTVLGQGAQAVRDGELLAAVSACHPETIRTVKWTVQKAKEASPQVLAS